MGNSPSNKIDRPFESYFSVAFERLSAFLTLSNPATNCFRIFHGFHEDLPQPIKGLSIDYYHSCILIQASQQIETIQEFLKENLPKNIALIFKLRFYENGKFLSKSTLLSDSITPTSFLVKENNRFFSVQLTDKLDTGLYLDTALVREWLFKNSLHKKILNLYSYTCSYGVAAILGGAFDVIHVDTSRTALQVGKSNYEANHIDVNPRSFCQIAVSDFLRFARKKKETFDIIIIDPSPPPFSFRSTDEKLNYYLGPIQKSSILLNPLGLLLVSCHNFLDLSPEQFKEAILKNRQELECIDTLNYPIEFEMNIPKMFIFKKRAEKQKISTNIDE